VSTMSLRQEFVQLASQEGANVRQLCRRFEISAKTVRNHIGNLYSKLGVGDRSQAVLYAVRKGLVEP